MTPEFERTLVWLLQTLLVGVLIVMLGGLFGEAFLFVEFGNEAESLGRIGLALLFAAGSVYFLLGNVSKMIDEKVEAVQPRSGTRTDDGESID